MPQNPDKLIIIAEPVHFGDTHVQVNSAFTALFSQVYARHRVRLAAEEKHIEAIRANAGDRVVYSSARPFKAYSRPGFLYWPQKIWGEWRQIVAVVREARKTRPELLVWLCLFPTGHMLLQWLSRIYLRGQKQLVVLHGELEYIKPQQKGLPDRFLSFVLKKALAGAGRNMSYIVLGDTIRTKLLGYGLVAEDKVSAMPHPYLYTNTAEKGRRLHQQALRICTFGTLKATKNTQLFFEMAARFEPEIRAGKLNFTTIGKLSEELNTYCSEYVAHYKASEFIPQQEYEQEISRYDLALFFYGNEHYSLTASGVVHECIRLGIPFLALHNDYFASVTKAHAVGVLFRSVDQMASYIRMAVINNDNQLEKAFKSSIFSFVQENSFLLQSEKLKKVLMSQNLYTIS